MSKYCPGCGSGRIYKTEQKSESGRDRWRCPDCKHRTTGPLSKPPVKYYSVKAGEIKKYKRFVITCAQNDTPIRTDFFTALLKYCEAEDAALLIIPVRYKNPDALHAGIQHDYTWPDQIVPYLCDSNIKINENLVVMGSIKVVATAANPLDGLDTISGESSAIIGHSQIAMKMVATPKNKLPKKIHTTGSVSEANYSQTKVGAKARHHHASGAIVVEAEGKLFWTRELMADETGGFYDLDKYYSEAGVTSGIAAAGIVYGDIHEKFLSNKVKSATFTDQFSLTNVLSPERKILHDILDQYSASPHHAKDHILQLQKHWSGDDRLRDELDSLCRFLELIGGGDVIESNHHDHLTRWLNNWKKTDLVNADLHYELMEMIRQSMRSGEIKKPLQLYMEKYCEAPLNFIDVDDDFMVAGIDCSQHGDRGANGSRPSPRAFANAGHKMMAGHSHTPRIEKGFWQVGTSTTSLDYAKGLSSWMITHGVIYQNGKRTLVDVINGKYRPSWAMKELREAA